MVFLVSILYQIGFYVLIGFALGMIVTIKWISPPDEDINIDFGKTKLVIKGRKNVVTDAIDVTEIADVAMSTTDKKKQTRKERVAARRAARKTKRNNQK